MNETEWREHVEHHRSEKDRFFAESDHSPIPEEVRANFDGLAYYEPDPSYRFVVDLEPDEPETIRVPTTTGDEQTYTRVGTFRLELPDGTIELAAYRTEGEDELFVPFQDATSGQETYGGGRYLEVPRLDDDTYLVDLNQAYHPFCVYNEDYACPLPPPENRVDVPIRAGERLPGT